MIAITKPKGAGLFTRSLGIALALGVAGGTLVAEPAMAQRRQQQKDEGPKITFSPAFQKAAAEFDKTLTAAMNNPAITAAADRARAATTPDAKAAPLAEVDAALGGGRAKIAAVEAAATTPGDKLKTGEMKRNVGILLDDLTLQHQGLVLMVDSGAMQAANLGQVQYLAGVTAYQLRNWAVAAQYLRPAYDGGYRDSQNLISRLLADSYKRSNNQAGAMEIMQRDLASGKPSEEAIRSALQAALDAKQAPTAYDLGVKLVQAYPTAASWNASIRVTRALAGLQAQENLDLMRLMFRTGAMQDATDYIEYIENADPRRLPGESLKVIDAAVAAGKLPTSDRFVVEARQIANGRLAADRASLPALERDARAGSATAATVSGAADAFLSYGEAAKAEEFYKSALNKAGADRNRTLLRLGIAQMDQGKAAEAGQNFAQVQGTRAPVAKLWSTYAASKSGATTAAAPAPAAR